jgi:hypothetical protein
MSCVDADSAVCVSKDIEVLVVLGQRRRPVKTKEGLKALVIAAKEVFKDILESGEGASSSDPPARISISDEYYFQVESKKWGGQLIDATALNDGDVVHMFRKDKVRLKWALQVSLVPRRFFNIAWVEKRPGSAQMSRSSILQCSSEVKRGNSGSGFDTRVLN